MITGDFHILGDIHGEANALTRLLQKLDHLHNGEHFSHPGCRVVFVGDFIDRGPQQVEVLAIVRAMHARGAAIAVMGNHEFKTIGWATK